MGENEEVIGKVFTFFSRPSVAAIRLTQGSLQVGNTIHIKGATTDFTQIVESIEIERIRYEKVEAGQDIGIKVKERVRPHDVVYKVINE